jgi:uncharacterized protein
MPILVDKQVMVTMRCGVRLATDVYREADGPARPALLVRLPYGKDALAILANPMLPDLFGLVDAGYVVVAQDVRGTGRSEGTFVPMVNEAADGADTIAWVREQSWCDGRVGMFGPSYLGFTQWLAARSSPPGLVAIAPAVTTADYHRAPWYHDGAFELATSLSWSAIMAAAIAARDLADSSTPHELAAAVYDPEPHECRLPLTNQPILQRHAPWYREWLGHPSYDDFWRTLSHRDSFDTVDIPALHIAGWYDIFLGATLDSYVGMRRHGRTERARRGQQLLVGPWAHSAAGALGVYPDRSFGASASVAAQHITDLHRRFFDGVMRAAADVERPVRIFVMGIDEWRDEHDWPLPDTQYVDYFLSSSGHANTAAGDGGLSSELPHVTEEDVYLYDPLRPVPTVGGAIIGLSPRRLVGPADQTAVEQRQERFSPLDVFRA